MDKCSMMLRIIEKESIEIKGSMIYFVELFSLISLHPVLRSQSITKDILISLRRKFVVSVVIHNMDVVS